MKTILITGFEPFGGETINPSWEAVRRLPDVINDKTLYKLQIPTVFGRAFQAILERAEALSPDVIICVGQAGGRKSITPEYAAINVKHAAIPDNDGNCPSYSKIVEDGPDGLFSTLDPIQMSESIRAAGIAGDVSFHAGTYVCNETLYRLLHRFSGTETRVGFIHIPFLPEQAHSGQPSMTLRDMIQGLQMCVSGI